MSDNDGKKTLGVRSGPRAGNVKQSFSHGRSKNVVVETKRKRVVVPKPGASKTSIQSSSKDGGTALPSGITDTEMERRLKALQAAKAREAEEGVGDRRGHHRRQAAGGEEVAERGDGLFRFTVLSDYEQHFLPFAEAASERRFF